MDKKKLNKILIRLIMVVVCFIIIILFLALKDGNKCLENPLTYGAKKISTEETGDFSCVCNFENPRYDQVYFNKERIVPLSEVKLKGGG